MSKQAEADMENPGEHKQISWDRLWLLELPLCLRSFSQPVPVPGICHFSLDPQWTTQHYKRFVP